MRAGCLLPERVCGVAAIPCGKGLVSVVGGCTEGSVTQEARHLLLLGAESAIWPGNEARRGVLCLAWGRLLSACTENCAPATDLFLSLVRAFRTRPLLPRAQPAAQSSRCPLQPSHREEAAAAQVALAPCPPVCGARCPSRSAMPAHRGQPTRSPRSFGVTGRLKRACYIHQHVRPPKPLDRRGLGGAPWGVWRPIRAARAPQPPLQPASARRHTSARPKAYSERRQQPIAAAAERTLAAAAVLGGPSTHPRRPRARTARNPLAHRAAHELSAPRLKEGTERKRRETTIGFSSQREEHGCSLTRARG